ncbi:MAG: tyrosine-type recombinase/integrase [Deltaproteobacteria bacterium]|jgi:site-specific recombinase XerD|nr:tyrosine-type recombinase/integrase [Deltaproteobacteria bacterium]
MDKDLRTGEKRAGTVLPALYAPDKKTAERVLEFFAAKIRNKNTRKAYARAAGDFAAWCEGRGVKDLALVRTLHVAAYIEELSKTVSAPSVKLKLAAIRMLFDHLVVSQVVAVNPAASVKGPKHVVKKGKTPVLSAAEASELLRAIDTSSLVGLRDRALIGTMVYTFARVGAVTRMRVEDVYLQGRRTWVRLHEKGGKRHETPCHHNLEEYLEAYIAGAGIATDGKGFLFRTAPGHAGELSSLPMAQQDVYRMIRRRAEDAGVRTKISCHSFRATGITEYLRNGGKLEVAQQMANHESARTTGLYDRRNDPISLDEVERILI